MRARTLETDYLVVGAGAAGMAFADTLISESDADVVLVDRRATPGGHWNDAYPFVRLHQPSVYYGANSLPLGDAIEPGGPEAGWYERASGPEVRGYYGRLMSKRLLPSGRVRFLPQCDHDGNRIVSRLTGEHFEIMIRKRLVDARYLSPNIPANTPPPFEVTAGARCIPVNQLVDIATRPERFVIIGAGKTALDACVWLLQNGVPPAAIQWIKPREAWLLNRLYCQPGELVGSMMEGFALQMEAAAQAASLDDLFARLEASAQVSRVDASVTPTMFKGSTIGDWEIELLRSIEDVVRMGHVRRIEPDRITLDDGTLATSPQHLHVHCAADGLRYPPALPIFARDRITLQPIRTGLVPFNAAVVGFVEAHREADAEKNRLCPNNPFPNVPRDWPRGQLIQMQADRAWSKEADITEWLERSRLNPTCGLRNSYGDPKVRDAAQRYADNVRPALARMMALVSNES